MIKGIMSGSGVNVQGGHTSFPYVPQNSSNPIQGMIRLNGQDLQVFDGSTWINLGAGYATVELNGESQALLQWAREFRAKQEEREQRLKHNPALRKAYDAIKRAEENFDMLEAIAGEYQAEESEK